MELQGQTISLSVYAGVNYPQGQGKLLRYRDGIHVGAVGMDFWREGLQIAGAMLGTLVLSTPAKIKMPLPAGIATSSNGIVAAETQTLWKLGDPIPEAGSLISRGIV